MATEAGRKMRPAVGWRAPMSPYALLTIPAKMAGPVNLFRWYAKYHTTPKIIKEPHNVELQFMLAGTTGTAMGKKEKSQVRMSQAMEKRLTARPHLPMFHGPICRGAPERRL